MSTASLPRERPITRYKIHWHVVLTHFPVSFFVASAGLMFLHVVTGDNCYDLGSFATLVGGAVAMVPATVTGWITWKNVYKGLRSRLFLYKIRISFTMIAISLLLVAYHTMLTIRSLDVLSGVWHAAYFAGTVLLVIGALAEGYYGGRLNHR